MKNPGSYSKTLQLYTIGHSTHPIEEFLEILKAHEIKQLIDVRSVPKSRHNPQFNQEELKASLKAAKISYKHMKGLGGRRHTTKSSVNTGWINASFRGFADYMQTDDFKKALEKLEIVAAKKKTAIMCAEGPSYRCHRSLIADALTVKKWKVFHIQSRKSAKRHKKNPFLKVKKGALLYPKPELYQNGEKTFENGELFLR